MIEKSLVLIKPDGVQRGLIGEIISRIERTGLKLTAMKMVYPSLEQAGDHYAVDDEWLTSVGAKQKASYAKQGIIIEKSDKEIGTSIREMLLEYLTQSPIVALVIEGHNAVAHIRKIVGATSPGDAAPGTIRGDFAFDTYNLADSSKRPIQNLIHATGQPHEADREIKIWFNANEIHTWKKVDEVLLYRVGK
ncbi:MAG: nucleoside-diphosphate kinase [Candidatus Woesearchaeota archaeon]